MSFCVWIGPPELLADGRFRQVCQVCGFTYCSGRVEGGSHQCRVQAVKRESPCVHRGGELRREQCKTCKGSVQLKVFACAVRGECTLGDEKGRGRLAGLECCATCGDYSAPS